MSRQKLFQSLNTFALCGYRRYAAFLWLRNRRFHFLLWPATKLANSPRLIRFDELRHSGLRTQLAGPPLHRARLS